MFERTFSKIHSQCFRSIGFVCSFFNWNFGGGRCFNSSSFLNFVNCHRISICSSSSWLRSGTSAVCRRVWLACFSLALQLRCGATCTSAIWLRFVALLTVRCLAFHRAAGAFVFLGLVQCVSGDHASAVLEGCTSWIGSDTLLQSAGFSLLFARSTYWAATTLITVWFVNHDFSTPSVLLNSRSTSSLSMYQLDSSFASHKLRIVVLQLFCTRLCLPRSANNRFLLSRLRARR